MALLVSVRSAAEAEAALAGGAALIDVKEPARGSLGRADEAVIRAVLGAVAGRRPVSAALGELAEKKGTSPRSQALLGNAGREAPLPGPTAGPICPGGAKRSFAAVRSQAPLGNEVGGLSLSYVKWGLAGLREPADWHGQLLRAARALPGACCPVAVAYADWRRAAAPSPAQVCDFACQQRWGAFLLDTWRKDGSTLLDWCPRRELAELRERCRAAGVAVALAGSLGTEQLLALRPLGPEWFAVRGAACREGRRTQTIDTDRVRRLVDLLAEPFTAAIAAS
jgi:uncharacterized protein (UPF0264 family)